MQVNNKLHKLQEALFISIVMCLVFSGIAVMPVISDANASGTGKASVTPKLELTESEPKLVREDQKFGITDFWARAGSYNLFEERHYELGNKSYLQIGTWTDGDSTAATGTDFTAGMSFSGETHFTDEYDDYVLRDYPRRIKISAPPGLLGSLLATKTRCEDKEFWHDSDKDLPQVEAPPCRKGPNAYQEALDAIVGRINIYTMVWQWYKWSTPGYGEDDYKEPGCDPIKKNGRFDRKCVDVLLWMGSYERGDWPFDGLAPLPGEVFNIDLNTVPDDLRKGAVAMLGIQIYFDKLRPTPGNFQYSIPVRMPVYLRTTGDYGLDLVIELPKRYYAEQFAEFGYKFKLGEAVATLFENAGDGGSGGQFLTNPSSCAQKDVTITTTSFGGETVKESVPYQPSGCSQSSFPGTPPFNVTVEGKNYEESQGPGEPTGFSTKLDFSGNKAHLKKAVVTLPEGMGLNPVAAQEMQSCSDGQFGWGKREDGSEGQIDNDLPTCPPQSEIGTVTAVTPLLPDPGSPGLDNHNPYALKGRVFLGTPDIANDKYPLLLSIVGQGIVSKLKGYASPDQASGQLRVEFDNLPPVTFSSLELDFKDPDDTVGSDHAVVTNPWACGSDYRAKADLTPWSAESFGFPQDSVLPVASTPFTVTRAPCTDKFEPTDELSSDTMLARAHPKARLRATAAATQSPIRRISKSLPAGLLGSLKGTGSCSDERAGSGDCPADSRIGTVTAAVGTARASENLPSVSGGLHLTPPKDGDPAGIAIVMPVKVGIFDYGTQVFRGKVKFNAADASLDVSADIPKLIHGVPIVVRDLVIDIDRHGFLVNPSNCSQRYGTGRSESDSEAASVQLPFQPEGCDQLDFTPESSVKVDVGGKLKAGSVKKKPKRKSKRTKKRRSHKRKKAKKPAKKRTKKISTKAYPTLSIKLAQREGEASIGEATVTLPKSLTPDIYSPALKNACPEEKLNAGGCPPESVIGQATAVTPLLDDPLTGPATLVKGESQSLPQLVIDLKGLVSVRLKGKITIGSSKLLETRLTNLPDVPLTSFRLDIYGSKRLLKAKTNLCDGVTRKMKIAYRGHNGKVAADLAPIRVDGCAKARASSKPKPKCSKLKQAIRGPKRRRARARKRYKKCVAKGIAKGLVISKT